MTAGVAVKYDEMKCATLEICCAEYSVDDGLRLVPEKTNDKTEKFTQYV